MEGQKNVWLFDIENDPNERDDVSDSQTGTVRFLLDRLAYYNSTAVPVRYPEFDPDADPAKHGGVWGPWMDWPLDLWAVKFSFSVKWSCGSLPLSTTSIDWLWLFWKKWCLPYSMSIGWELTEKSTHNLRYRLVLTHSIAVLKVIYHPLYSMNNFVTDKSKLPQDGAQVFTYLGWLAIMWPTENHMIANHPYKDIIIHTI